MLESTYIHCPGVGAKTERKIWEAGARTWGDYALRGEELCLSKGRREIIDGVVAESMVRLQQRDHAWFAKALPLREHWRAWRTFKDRVAFLDIETNGNLDNGALTVVGVYDGYRMRQFVRGDNLEEFPDYIADKALLVTFFGTGFDVPFLRRVYGLELPQLHIDLCFLLKRLGLSGGLKAIEGKLGIARSADTRGLDGWDAVRLWNEYRSGRDTSLETLLAYNAEDVFNMERLLEWAHPRMLEMTLGVPDSQKQIPAG